MGNPFSRQRGAQDEERAQGISAEGEGEGGVVQGLYFGPHFVLGGQRYAPTGPENFLFGALNSEMGPLSSFAMSRLPHPLPDLQATTTVRSHVNVKKSTLQLLRDQESVGVEFVFDCDKDCFISVHFMAKEVVVDNAVKISPADPSLSFPRTFYAKGIEQKFTLPKAYFLDLTKLPKEELFESGEDAPGMLHPFPIVILLETKDDSAKYTQSQSTFVALSKSGDGYSLKVIKQKITVDGVDYVLQEIYGIEQAQDNEPGQDDAAENTRECVVCMADPKDTIALPCRHLCLCSQCAEQLRFQSNKCPICRQPFHSLLQIKAGEAKEVEVEGQAEHSAIPSPEAGLKKEGQEGQEAGEKEGEEEKAEGEANGDGGGEEGERERGGDKEEPAEEGEGEGDQDGAADAPRTKARQKGKRKEEAAKEGDLTDEAKKQRRERKARRKNSADALEQGHAPEGEDSARQATQADPSVQPGGEERKAKKKKKKAPQDLSDPSGDLS